MQVELLASFTHLAPQDDDARGIVISLKTKRGSWFKWLLGLKS
jgi:hypothetical protein